MGCRTEVYDAELHGISSAIFACIQYAHDHPLLGIQHVHVFADNSAAIDRIFSVKPTPGQRWAEITQRNVDIFLQSNPDRTVEVGWVPSHSEIKGNEKSHKAARDGTERNDKRLNTLVHARRELRTRIIEKWKTEWNAHEPEGGFAPADRLPPSLTPSAHFKQLPRRIYSLIVQCRTRHAFIGEYYSNFVPTEDTACQCGVDFQTRRHILQECELYEPYRHILQEEVPDLSIPDLLGTPEGILATADFIAASGAFTKVGRWSAEDRQELDNL